MRYFHIMNDKKDKKVHKKMSLSIIWFFFMIKLKKKKIARQYCFLKELFFLKLNMLKPSFRN